MTLAGSDVKCSPIIEVDVVNLPEEILNALGVLLDCHEEEMGRRER